MDVGSSCLTGNAAYYVMLAIHPTTSVPYIAINDGSTSWRCTVLAFDGTSWSPVGSAGFSGQAANYQSIAFKPDTKAPYVAYQDGVSDLIVTSV